VKILNERSNSQYCPKNGSGLHRRKTMSDHVIRQLLKEDYRPRILLAVVG
jgi:hypothetical protein